MSSQTSVIVAWDFPALMTRFVSRASALPIPVSFGWTVFEGAVAEPDSGSGLDLIHGELKVSVAGFRIPDRDGSVSAWLAAHDAELSWAEVFRLVGVAGAAESTYVKTAWVLEDWGPDGRGGGYEFKLTDLLRPFSRSVYEDLATESFRLDPTAHSSGLTTGATTITLSESPAGRWAASGLALLWDRDARLGELVSYGSISGAQLLSVTRHVFAVGDPDANGTSNHVFPLDSTELRPAWAKRGNPITVALELMQTSPAAGSSTPAEIVVAGDFDTWPLPSEWDDSTVVPAPSSITEETSVVRSGSSVHLAISGSVASPQLSQTMPGFKPGKFYVLTFWVYCPMTNEHAVMRCDLTKLQTTIESLRPDTYGTGFSDSWSNVFSPSLTTLLHPLPRDRWTRFSLVFQAATVAAADPHDITIRFVFEVPTSKPLGFDDWYLEDVSVWGPYDERPTGPYDLGNGQGVGLRQTLINIERIEELRRLFYPEPVFTANGARTSGVAILLVETEPIDDCKAFLEEFVFRPFALYPLLDARERFYLERYYVGNPAVREIGDEWMKREFRPASWTRNYASRENNLALETDWDPSEGEFYRSVPRTQETSIARYKKSKLLRLQSRGGRTGKLGFPNYGSDLDVDDAAGQLFLEAANPWSELDVRAFWAHRDVDLGGLVRLNVPALLSLPDGGQSIAGGLFLVTRRRLALRRDQAHVELRVRQRRPISRPAILAPNSAASTYSSASEADRNWCYLAPDSSGIFADGTEAYTIP